jgi:hypothetical protein
MSANADGKPQVGSNIYPVIFIPGILGTTLADNYPIDHNVVYNPVKDLFTDFDPIMMDDSGQYDSYLDRYIQGNEIASIVYKKIVSELREELRLIKDDVYDEFVKVYLFPYDWRYPIAYNAARLSIFVDYIIAKSKAHKTYEKVRNADNKLVVDKVNLVGHSMGGCIAKHYATLLEGEKKINKLVFLASPLRGATDAVKQLTMGDSLFFGLITRKGKRKATRTFPGVYDLLPFDGYNTGTTPRWPSPSVVKNGVAVDIYKADNWQSNVKDALGPVLDNRLAEASGYFNASKDFSQGFQKNVLMVYGTGEKTLRTVKVDANGDYDFDSDSGFSKAGDGTVPAVSTYCNGIYRVGITKDMAGNGGLVGVVAGFHSTFCLHDTIIDLAIAFLQGKVLADVITKLTEKHKYKNIKNIGTYTTADMAKLDTEKPLNEPVAPAPV